MTFGFMKLQSPKKTTLWVMVAALSLYPVSFAIIKKRVVDRYERKNWRNVHGIRIWYNQVYYPLRWIRANGWSPLPHQRESEQGILENVDESNITLRQPQKHQTISIGFPPDPGIVRSAIGISTGDCVVVRLGVQLEQTHDRFVNRFLGITKCISEAEPDGAANESQPIRPDTN